MKKGAVLSKCGYLASWIKLHLFWLAIFVSCFSRTLRIGGELHLRGHVQDIPKEMAYCFIATNFTYGIKNTRWDSSRSTTREKFDELIKFDRCDCITRLESNIVRPRLTQVFISILWVYLSVGVARNWLRKMLWLTMIAAARSKKGKRIRSFKLYVLKLQ